MNTDSADGSPGSTESVLGTCTARGVLEGAFAVLDALACAENGLGLRALARISGLAKTSAYRLAEQLVDLGAVQRIEHRYYVGPQLARIGRYWQPDPRLREISQAPVHALAVQARCDMTALVILDGDRMRVVSATARWAVRIAPTRSTRKRSPAPPPDASCTPPGEGMRRSRIAGRHWNGGNCASGSVICTRP